MASARDGFTEARAASTDDRRLRMELEQALYKSSMNTIELMMKKNSLCDHALRALAQACEGGRMATAQEIGVSPENLQTVVNQVNSAFSWRQNKNIGFNNEYPFLPSPPIASDPCNPGAFCMERGLRDVILKKTTAAPVAAPRA